ncbi:MAG: type VI secretion system accessory protein TagJ [Novosphingobium sp.]
MNNADALLRQGDVNGARAALVDIVRSQPANEQARMFLFQLLAVSGEWDKARTQLAALVQLAANAQMLGATYNQVLDAEKKRAAVFAGAEDIALLAGEGSWADGVAKGINLLTRGDVAGAIAARDEAFDNAPDMPGTIDGVKFDWITDADSRFGPCFEIIIGGKYGLIPFDQIESITSAGPEDLRDTLWYPVQIRLRSGQSAAAFLFARYPGSEASADGAEKLGRATGWADAEWGQQGCGQRLLTLSEGDDRGILDVRSIVFD